MISPAITVIMGAYNHAPFVGAAIESVLNQTQPDFEFLIADDGSVDATPNVISAYDDPRIKFTSHLRNRGACVVLNELISRARGNYVAIINSDDVWPSHKLAYQLEFLEHHENCAAIFGRVAFIDRSGQRIPRGAFLRISLRPAESIFSAVAAPFF